MGTLFSSFPSNRGQQFSPSPSNQRCVSPIAIHIPPVLTNAVKIVQTEGGICLIPTPTNAAPALSNPTPTHNASAPTNLPVSDPHVHPGVTLHNAAPSPIPGENQVTRDLNSTSFAPEIAPVENHVARDVADVPLKSHETTGDILAGEAQAGEINFESWSGDGGFNFENNDGVDGISEEEEVKRAVGDNTLSFDNENGNDVDGTYVAPVVVTKRTMNKVDSRGVLLHLPVFPVKSENTQSGYQYPGYEHESQYVPTIRNPWYPGRIQKLIEIVMGDECPRIRMRVDWDEVAKKLGTGHTGYQCRDKYRMFMKETGCEETECEVDENEEEKSDEDENLWTDEFAQKLVSYVESKKCPKRGPKRVDWKKVAKHLNTKISSDEMREKYKYLRRLHKRKSEAVENGLTKEKRQKTEMPLLPVNEAP